MKENVGLTAAMGERRPIKTAAVAARLVIAKAFMFGMVNPFEIRSVDLEAVVDVWNEMEGTSSGQRSCMTVGRSVVFIISRKSRKNIYCPGGVG